MRQNTQQIIKLYELILDQGYLSLITHYYDKTGVEYELFYIGGGPIEGPPLAAAPEIIKNI